MTAVSSDFSVLVLSPHRDDAAFSCGLFLKELLATGSRIIIANICTISDYAPYLPQTAGDRTTQVSAAREAEDAAFLASLAESASAGFDSIRFVDLAWKDAPLRYALPAEQVLDMSPLHGEEVADLVQQMKGLPRADFILAPLALGGHVDHRLVRDAAIAAFAPDELLFYEDLPYACRMPTEHAEAAAFATLPGAESVLMPEGATRDLKQTYAACYPSQIAFTVAEEMEAYAKALGYRERFYGHPSTVDKLKQALMKSGVVL